MKKKGDFNFFSLLLKIIGFLFGTIFFLAIFLFIIIVSINIYNTNNGKKPILNLYTIISPSMVPTINVYDVVVDIPVYSDSEIKKGDIITFNSRYIDTNGYTITHRIYDISTYEDGTIYYYTKGDNNEHEDSGVITVDDIEGKVILVLPQLGRVQEFLSSKNGWLIFILIPSIIIVINDIIKIIRVLKIRKQVEEIPGTDDVENIREKEENAKLKELIERANEFNKK